MSSTYKRCSVRLYFHVFVGVRMSYLRYLCLCVNSGVRRIMCYVFVLFFFILCTLCCQCLWIVFVLFVFILCTQCCQCLWIVFVLFFLHLVYPMLSVSLDDPFSILLCLFLVYFRKFNREFCMSLLFILQVGCL